MSLRGRLTLGIGTVLALVMVALWFGIGAGARHLAEEYVASRLEHDAESLLAAISLTATGPALAPAAISPAYVRPYSGHYFVIWNEGGEVRSRSLWDAELARPAPPTTATSPVRYRREGPMGQSLLVFVRQYQRQGQAITVAVAEDLAPLERRIADFQWLLLGVLVGTLGVALLLQAYAVQRGLAPLERLRGEVARLQQGQVAALAAATPSEVTPLVREINHLLQLIAQRLERSRNALGDLAHALKGPLSRLVRGAEAPQSGLTPDARAWLKAETATVRALLDRELTRARLAGHARPGQHFHPADEIPHLVKAIRGIYGDKALAVDARVDVERRVAFDRDDMLELLGNLLDNAAKWAQGHIRITVFDDPGLHVIIEDDGPGCADADLASLTTRGKRLDESTSGTGLGLSIANAIVNEYHGSLTLGHSATLGGFLAEVRLPPAHAR
jgi:signal transduction histidine kinase